LLFFNTAGDQQLEVGAACKCSYIFFY